MHSNDKFAIWSFWKVPEGPALGGFAPNMLRSSYE